MKRLKLQTQLLVAVVGVVVLMTAAALFAIHLSLRSEVERREREDVAASVTAFRSVQAARESQLSRAAALLAEIPTLKALVSTGDQATVEDGSEPFFRLSGSDLFLLATSTGRVLGLHAKRDGWTQDVASKHLQNAIARSQTSGWWVDENRIYWVFLHPISAGSGLEQRDLGFVVVGYEIGAGIAEQLARESRSAIALATDHRILASTLTESETTALERELRQNSRIAGGRPTGVTLSQRAYSLASFGLADESESPVRCYVLSSQEAAAQFLRRVDRVLLLCAVLSIISAAFFVQVISRAVTGSLQEVILGIEALANGDYTYRLGAGGNREVDRLAGSFSVMRGRLLESQRHLLAAERMAVLDQTASSISHDLRHFLAAVLANAEFLYEAELTKNERSEIYREIRMATDQMLDLIESMKELSREHPALRISSADLDEVIERSIDMVEARRDCANISIKVRRLGDMKGSFDSRKLERVFFNLLLNACEAVGQESEAQVEVQMESHEHEFVVRVLDNGVGIPPSVAAHIFDPFVSFGKSNGTGLGLAIANKIITEHGGTIRVEKTSTNGTSLLVSFPKHAEPQAVLSNQA